MRPEVLDILEETDQNQYSEFSTNRDTFYTLYDNYHYQGNELSTLCFYKYCCQIQVVKLRYAKSSHIRFDIRHPQYSSLCQIVAEHRDNLITPSIYGKTTDHEDTGEAVAGDLHNSGPIWNDHCKVVLGLFVPWNLLPALFKDNSIGYTDPSDASSLIWRNISSSQPDYIRQLASNLELLRKSKEDAKADRIARDLELLRKSKEDAKADRIARDLESLDFDDLDMDNSMADDDIIDMLPYVPKTMTKSKLFQAFYSIQLRWESLACSGLQPVTLLNPILGPIPDDCLKADRSLSYVYDTYSQRLEICWIRSVANGGIVRKLGWPGLEFTVFITINLEGCLSQVAGVRPAIYPTYRIAMPPYIASALPP